MNHFIIGLGDTGGDIIDAFDTLLQQYSNPAKDTLSKEKQKAHDETHNALNNELNDTLPTVDYLHIHANIDNDATKHTSINAFNPATHTEETNLILESDDFQALYTALQSNNPQSEWLKEDSWSTIFKKNNSDSIPCSNNRQNLDYLTKRRLVRLLFAKHIHQFIQKIQKKTHQLKQKSGSRKICFHVLANLSDGISSGLLIDVLVQLRKLFPVSLDGMNLQSDQHAILAYTYLPDTPPVAWSHKNYHANAYASLLELNALSTNRWQPYDLSSLNVSNIDTHSTNHNSHSHLHSIRNYLNKHNTTDTNNARISELNLIQVFNACYVFSGKHNEDYNISIDKSLPLMVAEFIFQKNMITNQQNRQQHKQHWHLLDEIEQPSNDFATTNHFSDHNYDKSSNGSNNNRNNSPNENTNQTLNSSNNNKDPKNTTFSPLFSPELEYGRPSRSIRFMNFGLSRIEYPESLLHKTLSYHYQQQAIAQIQFNHWQDNQGYIDSTTTSATSRQYLERINDEKSQQKWQVSDGYLLLEIPNSRDKNSKKWQPHDATWMAYGKHYQSIACTTKVNNWLDELYRLMNNCYEEQYRGLGVVKFFKTEADNKNVDDTLSHNRLSYAHHTRDLIEQDLLMQLKEGHISLVECSNILSALKLHLESRMVKANTQLSTYNSRAKRYFEYYSIIKHSWRTKYSTIIKSKDPCDDWDIATIYLQGHYTCLTYHHACNFQKQLINQLLVLLSDLQNQIHDCNSALSKMFKTAKSISNSDTILEIFDSEQQSSEQQSMDVNEASNKQANEQAANKARETDSPIDKKSHTHYNSEILINKQVQQTYRKLLTHKKIQISNATSSRKILFETLGSKPSFQGIIDIRRQINKQILKNAYQQVKSSHDKYISIENKILGVSVIDRLYATHLDDVDGLTAELYTLLDSAEPLTPISEEENTATSNTTAIFLPKISKDMMPKQRIFFKNIKYIFQSYQEKNPNKKINVIQTVNIKPDNTNGTNIDNIITVVSVNYALPLHSLSIINQLKDSYKKRLMHNMNSAYELHLEGNGFYLPRISVLPNSKIKSILKPVILLSIHHNLLPEQMLSENSNEINLLTLVETISDSQMVYLLDYLRPLLSENIPYNKEMIDDLLKNIRPQIVKVSQQIEEIYPPQSKQALETIEDWNISMRQVVKIVKGRAQL